MNTSESLPMHETQDAFDIQSDPLDCKVLFKLDMISNIKKENPSLTKDQIAMMIKDSWNIASKEMKSYYRKKEKDLKALGRELYKERIMREKRANVRSYKRQVKYPPSPSPPSSYPPSPLSVYSMSSEHVSNQEPSPTSNVLHDYYLSSDSNEDEELIDCDKSRSCSFSSSDSPMISPFLSPIMEQRSDSIYLSHMNSDHDRNCGQEMQFAFFLK